MDLEEEASDVVDWIHLEQGAAVGSCEHGNKMFGFYESRTISLGEQESASEESCSNDSWLLKNRSARNTVQCGIVSVFQLHRSQA